MDTANRQLTELEWIAYLAQERGWNGLAARIARDAADIQSKQAPRSHLVRTDKELEMNSSHHEKYAEHVTACWALADRKRLCSDDAAEGDEERPSSEKTSFDRLKDLERSWREDRIRSRLHDSHQFDEFWRDLTGSNTSTRTS